MPRDIVNFNAGPAGLPRPALERARDELLDFDATGISVMEHSHRGKAYEKMHNEALALVRKLLSVPDSHAVAFLQGGASYMFATVPINFLLPGKSADYVITGAWSKKAIEEAKKIGKTRVAGTGEKNGKFVHIPTQDELQIDPGAAYVHITSNNTIAGTQYQSFFDPRGVPLVADMSSDLMWRPFDVSKFHLIYAGAQKNIGPSGIVVLIVDKAWAEAVPETIPTYFRFQTHIKENSLYNTPPTFSVYMVRNVLAHIDSIGGLPAMEKINREKGRIVYQAIDGSGGFYRSPVEREARSFMNIVFRLPSEELEERFVKEADQEGMIGLKGHRSVGGCRASTYNAVTVEGARRLADFMKAFAAKNG